MKNVQVHLSTEPSSAKASATIYQFWIIDDDPQTPHQTFENEQEPLVAQLDIQNEYMFYLHGKFPGSTKVKVSIGLNSKEYKPEADGFIKKMGHINL
jgi:hypothetical protein